MFVKFAKICAIAALISLPIAITANADVVKPQEQQSKLIDNTITSGIFHGGQNFKKGKKYKFGKNAQRYNGPMEPIFINGI